MIKIDFIKTDGIYTLVDALCLPDDNVLTDLEIQQMKQDRFNKWVTLILTPSLDTSTSSSGSII